MRIEEYYRRQARYIYEDEGTLEVAADAPISRSRGGDAGAYVEAWVWVPNPGCYACCEPITEIDEIINDGKLFCRACEEERELDKPKSRRAIRNAMHSRRHT